MMEWHVNCVSYIYSLLKREKQKIPPSTCLKQLTKLLQHTIKCTNMQDSTSVWYFISQRAWIFKKRVSTYHNFGFPSRSLQEAVKKQLRSSLEAVNELLVHTSFSKDMHGCLSSNVQSIANFFLLFF